MSITAIHTEWHELSYSYRAGAKPFGNKKTLIIIIGQDRDAVFIYSFIHSFIQIWWRELKSHAWTNIHTYIYMLGKESRWRRKKMKKEMDWIVWKPAGTERGRLYHKQQQQQQQHLHTYLSFHTKPVRHGAGLPTGCIHRYIHTYIHI